MTVKVLGIRTDGTVEMLDKEPNDPEFWRKYVGQEVDHLLIGQWSKPGRPVFLTMWMDEWGSQRQGAKINTVATALPGLFGKVMTQGIRGDVVVSHDSPDESLDVPEFVGKIAQAIAELHKHVGIIRR